MRKSRGIALLVALFVLVFLFILGIAFRFMTDQHYIFSSDVARRTELYYLAEAGVEYTIARRANWRDNPHEEQLSLPNGFVIIKVQDAGSSFTINSRGVFTVEGSSSIIRNNQVIIDATIDNTGAFTRREVIYN